MISLTSAGIFQIPSNKNYHTGKYFPSLAEPSLGLPPNSYHLGMTPPLITTKAGPTTPTKLEDTSGSESDDPTQHNFTLTPDLLSTIHPTHFSLKNSFRTQTLSFYQCSQRGSPSVLKEGRGGRRRVIPFGLFPNLPYHPPPRTRGPAVPRGKCLMLAVPAITYSPTVPHRPRQFTAAPRRPPPSCTFPYANLPYIVGHAVLNNDGRPEISRTRTDRILPFRPVQGSWQSPPPGPARAPDC